MASKRALVLRDGSTMVYDRAEKQYRPATLGEEQLVLASLGLRAEDRVKLYVGN